MILVASLSFFQSCSNSELDLNSKMDTQITNMKSFSEITPENKEFKSLLLNTENIVKLKRNVNSNDRQNAPSRSNEEAIKKQIHEHTISSMKMLKSYGVEYKDIAQYVDNEDDPRIALMGMIFITLQKTKKNASLNNSNGLQKNKRFKSKSTENDLFPLDKVKHCILDAVGLAIIADGVFGSATTFTLETAIGIAGRVASRTLGVVGAAYAIVDFGDCMGWYDIW